MLLPASYYQKSNVVEIARDLIGKTLYTRINGKVTGGLITETEAYAGITDKAAHSYGGRRTARTEVMYSEGGVSYVYLCYGIHYLFNIVTNIRDIPEAVLVRAIYPVAGEKEILKRRNAKVLKKELFNGPGKVSIAMGINMAHNQLSLISNEAIWLQDDKIKFNRQQILSGPRIGVDYAGEDALLPYRFWIEDPEKVFNLQKLKKKAEAFSIQ